MPQNFPRFKKLKPGDLVKIKDYVWLPAEFNSGTIHIDHRNVMIYLGCAFASGDTVSCNTKEIDIMLLTRLGVCRVWWKRFVKDYEKLGSIG